MAFVTPHTIDDYRVIGAWVSTQRKVAASGLDGKARRKALVLDMNESDDFVEAFWAVEATNDRGEVYIALTTPKMNVAIEFYNEL